MLGSAYRVKDPSLIPLGLAEHRSPVAIERAVLSSWLCELQAQQSLTSKPA
jgi:hypothetical protein